MPRPRHKKHRFIDPKREATVTFNLVHRSQRDPLAADEEAPQHVLQLTRESRPNTETLRKKKEEERKWGVFYDDEYDYMQHLKDRNAVQHDWDKADEFLKQAKDRLRKTGEDDDDDDEKDEEKEEEAVFKIPAEAFASKNEEPIGLLNKAAPRSGPLFDWDPDIVETLDDEFKCEQVFTMEQDGDNSQVDGDWDDFFTKAMEEPDVDDSDVNSDFDAYGSELEDDVPSMQSFGDDEVKSKFTEYSMTSSVIPRSEHLQTLDERFEKFFDEYEDENTGALDMEEIEGVKGDNSEIMKHVLSDFKKSVAEERQRPDFERIVNRIQDKEENDEDEEDLDEQAKTLIEVENIEDKWDCETILSTYSNLYHRPRLISEPSKKTSQIKISGKTGLPKDVFGKGLTASALKQFDQLNGTYRGDEETATLASRVSALSIRNKHETLDEKRARKQALKEHRRERRVEKKATALQFKEMKRFDDKGAINKKKNQGVKLTV